MKQVLSIHFHTITFQQVTFQPDFTTHINCLQHVLYHLFNASAQHLHTTATHRDTTPTPRIHNSTIHHTEQHTNTPQSRANVAGPPHSIHTTPHHTNTLEARVEGTKASINLSKAKKRRQQGNFSSDKNHSSS